MSVLTPLFQLLVMLLSGLVLIVSLSLFFGSVFTFIAGFFYWKPLWVTEVLPPDGALLPAPDEVNNQLARLDFLQAGAIKTRLRFSHAPGYDWVYVSRDGYIYAEVRQRKEGVGVRFSSRFSDNAMIATSFPSGTDIRTPNYHERYATSSVETAYEYHRQQITLWQAARRMPLLSRNIDDILQHDDISLLLYWRTVNRRHNLRSLILGGLCLLVASSGGLAAFLAPYSDLPQLLFPLIVIFAVALLTRKIALGQMKALQQPQARIDTTEQPKP